MVGLAGRIIVETEVNSVRRDLTEISRVRESKEYFLSAYCVPNTKLNVGDITLNKAGKVSICLPSRGKQH